MSKCELTWVLDMVFNTSSTSLVQFSARMTHSVGGEIYGPAIFGPTQPDVVHRDFASVVEDGAWSREWTNFVQCFAMILNVLVFFLILAPAPSMLMSTPLMGYPSLINEDGHRMKWLRPRLYPGICLACARVAPFRLTYSAQHVLECPAACYKNHYLHSIKGVFQVTRQDVIIATRASSM